jgi:hypothetical protein
LASALVGSSIFLGDQRGRHFRFFTEHGVAPKYVWLSRHLVSLVALVILAIVIAVQHWIGGDQWPRSVILTAATLAYCAGQFCSLMIRSGLLAAFFGIVLGGVLLGWLCLMGLLEINWWWSVAPLPLVLLWATWLHVPDWLVERNTWRAWLRVGAAVGLPTAALLVAVPVYRVEQIPVVEPGFSLQEFLRPNTPEEQETADMYRKAAGALSRIGFETAPNDNEQTIAAKRKAYFFAWVQENGEPLALTLEATRRPSCRFFPDPGRFEVDIELQGQLESLRALLYWSAQKLTDDGNLDEAFDHYMATLRMSGHIRSGGTFEWQLEGNSWEKNVYSALSDWAVHGGQTSARIRAGIDELKNLQEKLPLPTDAAIKADYLQVRRFLSGDASLLADLDLTSEMHLAWQTFIPGQRRRALRLLNLLTAYDLRMFEEAQLMLSSEAGIDGFLLRNYDTQQWLKQAQRADRKMFDWLRTTFTPRPFEGQLSLVLASGMAQCETRRRATRIILALEAWKAEHGKLPQSLDELVGAGLDRLPVDPYTGQPFRYFPEGLTLPEDPTLASSIESRRKVELNKPLIWSSGAGGARGDVWSHGDWFLIP